MQMEASGAVLLRGKNDCKLALLENVLINFFAEQDPAHTFSHNCKLIKAGNHAISSILKTSHPLNLGLFVSSSRFQ